MTRCLVVLVISIALAGCATRPPHPGTFSFAVLGDAPYTAREDVAFDAMIGRMSVESLAFAVHIGDFKAGGDSPCTDALFADRKARLDASRHPVVLTPGDNDWTDCRRESNGKMDPLERLAKLRDVFFADEWSLGRTRMPLAKQGGCAERDGAGCACPGLPENRLWTKNGIVFATVHVVGSNDNRGFDAANDAEQRCRSAAGRAWIERAVRLAEGTGTHGLVLFTHANPWVASRDKVYDPLLAQIAAAGRRLSKPVLFVHGDTHSYQVDHPFRDGFGAVVGNIVRLETFGSANVGWVRVTADPNDPQLFRMTPNPEPPAEGG
jgi:hypothetical protein